MIAWIFVAAVGIVMAAEINVVRVKHLYPRSLMTPFTDDVDLTAADQETYTAAAVAQGAKGFESVDVTFENDGQNGPPRVARAPPGFTATAVVPDRGPSASVDHTTRGRLRLFDGAGSAHRAPGRQGDVRSRELLGEQRAGPKSGLHRGVAEDESR